MNAQTDSIDAMRPEEIRALVVALLERVGGDVTLTEGELWRAYRDDPARLPGRVVQIEVTDFPRTVRVRFVRNDIVAGTVTA